MRRRHQRRQLKPLRKAGYLRFIDYGRAHQFMQNDYRHRVDILGIPEKIKELTLGEQILYADAPMSARSSIVLTNRRMILYTMNFSSWSGSPKSFKTIDVHKLSDLKSVTIINAGYIYSDIKFGTDVGTFIISNLLKSDADKIFALINGIIEVQ